MESQSKYSFIMASFTQFNVLEMTHVAKVFSVSLRSHLPENLQDETIQP